MFGLINTYAKSVFALTVYCFTLITGAVSAQQYRLPGDTPTTQSDTVKLDVIIPVFDPNIPTEAESAVWPEVRRAEAIRFAHLTKLALDQTGAFGAVRVTPDDGMYGDLYVFGKIIEANGEDVTIEMSVNDIRGKKTARAWMRPTDFTHRVNASFFSDGRSAGLDAYTPVFDKFAAALSKKLTKVKPRTVSQIKSTSEMLFAYSLSAEKFEPFLRIKGRGQNVRVDVKGLPDAADPLYQRVRTLRLLEQQYADEFQANYEAYVRDSNKDYFAWQRSAYPIVAEYRREKAKLDAELMKVAGQLAMCQLLNTCERPIIGYRDSLVERIARMVADHIAKKRALRESFGGAQVLNEMGEALNFSLQDKNIAIEGVSVELRGTTLDHFRSYRAFVRELYEKEITPDVQL